jgi:hypothetical protein
LHQSPIFVYDLYETQFFMTKTKRCDTRVSLGGTTLVVLG